jgi:heterogeneous nuclear ribonucleoprotein U-like protein 1
MNANIKDCTAGLMAPDNKNCEVVMLVGLPCSGKTTWAKKMMKTDIMKNYTLIGYESIITQMHLERKDQRLNISKEILECFESIYWTLLGLAGTKERNFIIDDFNATPEGRKLVLKNFPGLIKKAVVFLPKLSEIQKRFDSSSEKRITPEQFHDMLSYFSIPRKIGTTFSDIHYIDTRTPEDIVNEYRSAVKTNPTSQNTSILSKSTDHAPPTSYNPPNPHTIQSERLTHSIPLTSINLNNYYPDNIRRSYIPYRRVPHFTENTFRNQQIGVNGMYPGMKLSRSDYYVSMKPSLYPFQQHTLVYPINYSSNPHQFLNY